MRVQITRSKGQRVIEYEMLVGMIGPETDSDKPEQSGQT